MTNPSDPLANMTPEQKRAMLARMLRERQQQAKPAPPPYLIPLQPAGSQPPLFCMHPLGGDVLVYIGLAHHLGKEQPLYGIQAPAFSQDVAPLATVEEVATSYIEAIRTVQQAGPYHLAGLSFGGIVAFEMARQLQQQGEQIAFLGLFDAVLIDPASDPPVAPLLVELAEVIERHAGDDARTWIELTRLIGVVLTLFPVDLPISSAEIQQLTPDTWVAYVMNLIRMANLLPPDIGPADVGRFLNVLRTNLYALRAYVPQVYNGDALLILSGEGYSCYIQEPQHTWSAVVTGTLETHMLAGSHLLLLQKENIPHLVAHMQRHQTARSAPTSAPQSGGSGTTGKVPQQHGMNLEAEVVLDTTITAPPAYQHSPATTDTERPATFFLTGATGYLGAYLLHALLIQTNAHIICLVRAATPEAGMQRIRVNMEQYGLWRDDAGVAERVHALVGDVGKPLLGLTPEAFAELAERIDRVYHNAALTNFAYTYDMIKAVNVQGTHEALRLASQSRVKPFHYVSTIGVFESLLFTRERISEQDELGPSEGQTLGYTQSKWVSESIVACARARGLPVTVYRPPLISGDSTVGYPNESDFVWYLVKGCVALGSAPDLPALNLLLSPVDYVADAVVALSCQSAVAGQIFHLTNPHPPLSWHQFCAWIESQGYPLRTLPYTAWYAKLDTYAKEKHDRRLGLLAATMHDMRRAFDVLAQPVRMAHIDCQHTVGYLNGTGIACPPMETLLETYAAFFARKGFLETF